MKSAEREFEGREGGRGVKERGEVVGLLLTFGGVLCLVVVHKFSVEVSLAEGDTVAAVSTI